MLTHFPFVMAAHMTPHTLEQSTDTEEDHSDMPPLVDAEDNMHSSVTGVLQRPLDANVNPIVITFECQNMSTADMLQFIICSMTKRKNRYAWLNAAIAPYI